MTIGKIGPIRQLEDLTVEDEALISARDAVDYAPDRIVDRLLKMLTGLRESASTRIGFISVYDHSLQAATRAYRDGADTEMVVALLLHDLFDELANDNHSQVAAELLRPYVSDDTYWIIKHHGVFQLYHHPTFRPELRNARERFRDHPLFERTAAFCARWDQAAFDPDYDTLPLEFFEPMVREVFSRVNAEKLWPA